MPDDRKSIFDLDGDGNRGRGAIPISPLENDEDGAMGGDPVALFGHVVQMLQQIAKMVPQLAPVISRFLQDISSAAAGGGESMGAPPSGPPGFPKPGMGGGLGRPQGSPASGMGGGMPPGMRMGR